MAARLLIVALLLAAALPARAEKDVPLPSLTPNGKHLFLTRESGTTSSKCIGNPVTPMCAVETLMACFVRGDDSLCQTAMGVPADKVPPMGELSDWPSIVYHVVRAEVLTDKHFPWPPTYNLDWRPGEPSVRPSDIRIDVVRRECFETPIVPRNCEVPVRQTSGPIAYIVRREGSRWAVITWGDAY
jgi:hypothetical protein